MRALLIFSLTLAGFGLVISKDQAAGCEREIKLICRPEYKEWEANHTARYSEACKKTFAGIKDELEKKYSDACLNKEDLNKTCAALYAVNKEFFKKMGGHKCIPKVIMCGSYVESNCKKPLDEEAYIKLLTKRSPQFGTDVCIKKIKEVRPVSLKKMAAACEGKTDLKKLSNADLKKICETVHQINNEYNVNLGADCAKKMNGTEIN